MTNYLKQKPLLVIILISLFVRIIYLLFTPLDKLVSFEASIFDQRATSLAEGITTTTPAIVASFHIFLAPLYKVLQVLGIFHLRVWFVVFINICLALVAIWLFYRLARVVYPDRKKFVVLATILFGLYYPYIYINALILSENLFIPVILAIFLLSTDKHKRLLLIGCLLGIAIVIRPITLPFIPLYCIWLFPQLKNRFINFAKLFLPVVVIILIISAINQANDTDRQFSYAGNGGANFVLTWCQPRRLIYGGEWYSPPIFHGKNPDTDLTITQPFYNTGYLLELGLQCISEHPLRIFTNILNVNNVLDGVFYPNLRTRDPMHNELLVAWKAITYLSLIAFLYFPFHTKQRKYWGLAVTLLVSLVLAVYISNPGEERYLVSYAFALILFLPPFINLIVTSANKALHNAASWPLPKIISSWLSILVIVVILSVGGGSWFIGELNQMRRPIKIYEAPSKELANSTYKSLTSWAINYIQTASLEERIELAAPLTLAKDLNSAEQSKLTAIIQELLQSTVVEGDTSYVNVRNDNRVYYSAKLLLALNSHSLINRNQLAKYILSQQNQSGEFKGERSTIGMYVCAILYQETMLPEYKECRDKSIGFYKQSTELDDQAWLALTTSSEEYLPTLVAAQYQESGYNHLIGSFMMEPKSAFYTYALSKLDRGHNLEYGIYNLIELQIASENEAISTYRNQLSVSAEVNGWALFALNSYVYQD